MNAWLLTEKFLVIVFVSIVLAYAASYIGSLFVLIISALRRLVGPPPTPIRVGERVRALPTGGVYTLSHGIDPPAVEGVVISVSASLLHVKDDFGVMRDCYVAGAVRLDSAE